MLKRTLIALLIFIPLSASALTTTEEIQLQIQALLREIAELEAQLQTTATPSPPSTGSGQATPAITTNIATYCPSLSNTLVRGSRDSSTQGEVSELQKFLAGYFNITPTDLVTGYFGPITEGHVIRFQSEKGLPPVGIVGPRTRAAISASCATKSQAVVPPTNPCIWNGLSVPHGAGVNAYYTSTVAAGETCLLQWRVCSNGVLSGSYLYSSCTVSAPITRQSCTFNGQTIQHGGSVLAYQKA